jgi:cyanobactin maturation PatA/PatG family protease
LGQIAFDFGTEARRDAFEQAGGREVVTDPSALLAFLQDKPWEATAVTWTLQQEATPIYALQPLGPFGRETYQRIRDLLKSQIEEGATEVSIPAVLGPPVMLLNGHQVPVVFPEIRGMFGWSSTKLVQEVIGTRPENPEKQEEYDRIREDIENFLDRLYYELSNLGVTPQERAINYAATNLYQVASVYKEAIQKELKLDRITTERSHSSRPNSECWDVILTLFDPQQRYERAREVYRLTVDVSEIIPVTVGKLRRWSVY